MYKIHMVFNDSRGQCLLYRKFDTEIEAVNYARGFYDGCTHCAEYPEIRIFNPEGKNILKKAV